MRLQASDPQRWLIHGAVFSVDWEPLAARVCGGVRGRGRNVPTELCSVGIVRWCVRGAECEWDGVSTGRSVSSVRSGRAGRRPVTAAVRPAGQSLRSGGPGGPGGPGGCPSSAGHRAVFTQLVRAPRPATERPRHHHLRRRRRRRLRPGQTSRYAGVIGREAPYRTLRDTGCLADSHTRTRRTAVVIAACLYLGTM